jgi:hypothetical protein
MENDRAENKTGFQTLLLLLFLVPAVVLLQAPHLEPCCGDAASIPWWKSKREQVRGDKVKQNF